MVVFCSTNIGGAAKNNIGGVAVYVLVNQVIEISFEMREGR